MVYIFIIILCLVDIFSNALVLEELIERNELCSTFQNKNICFYPGSFDPIHKGHEDVAISSLENGLCNFVILYPSRNDDSHKKLVDLNLRLDMIFSIFKNHPSIIVTKFHPYELQDALTTPYNNKDKIFVRPICSITFYGIVGSDSSLKTWPSDDDSFAFMAGMKIPEQYKFHTMGGLMALPVDSFIIAIRNNDDISTLKGKVSERRIIAIINSKRTKDISSTLIRSSIKRSESVDNILSEPVMVIIKKYNLYTEMVTTHFPYKPKKKVEVYCTGHKNSDKYTSYFY